MISVLFKPNLSINPSMALTFRSLSNQACDLSVIFTSEHLRAKLLALCLGTCDSRGFPLRAPFLCVLATSTLG